MLYVLKLIIETHSMITHQIMQQVKVLNENVYDIIYLIKRSFGMRYGLRKYHKTTFGMPFTGLRKK